MLSISTTASPSISTASAVFAASSSVSAYFIAGAADPEAKIDTQSASSVFPEPGAGALIAPSGECGRLRCTSAVSANDSATALSHSASNGKVENAFASLSSAAAASAWVGDSAIAGNSTPH